MMTGHTISQAKSEQTNSQSVHVLGFSAMNLDYFCRPESIVQDDETTMPKPQQHAGGSAANTIYALAKWEVPTGVLGIVGKDAAGSKLIMDLQRVGVDTSRVKEADGRETGFVLCLSDRKGREALYVWPGANDYLELDELDTTYASRTSLIHFSSFVSERQLELQKQLISMLPSTVKISFSPGSIYVRKGLKAIEPLIERAEVVFLNQRQLRELTKKGYRRGAQTMLDIGCKLVCVTFGKGLLVTEQGVPAFAVASYVRDTHSEHQEPAREGVKVQDTVGAGDAFAAGFLYGRLVGDPLDRCGFLGVEAAVGCVSRMGAREGIPSFEELSRTYRGKFRENLRRWPQVVSR